MKNNYKLYLFFILFYSTSLIHNIYAYALYEPEVPDVISIALKSKAIKKYQKNILGILKSSSQNISDNYKKKIKARIGIINQGNNITQWNNATIRVSGDWKDHVNSVGFHTSLKIKLKKGSVGGIVRFRLL